MGFKITEVLLLFTRQGPISRKGCQASCQELVNLLNSGHPSQSEGTSSLTLFTIPDRWISAEGRSKAFPMTEARRLSTGSHSSSNLRGHSEVFGHTGSIASLRSVRGFNCLQFPRSQRQNELR